LFATIGLLVATAIALMCIHKRLFLWPAAGWLLFLIASAPEASFVLFDPIFEHRVYLPAAFLIPGIASVLFLPAIYSRSGLHVRMGLLLLAASLAWQTIERNRHWAEPTKLWDHALAAGAKENRAQANAGRAALQKGRLEVARRYLQPRQAESDQGASPEGPNVQGYNALARAALIEGRPQDALGWARDRLTALPTDSTAAFLYGMAMVQLGRLDEARDMARQMYEQIPEAPATTLLYALIQKSAGSPEAARDMLRDWLGSDRDAPLPELHFVRLYLANMLYEAGQARTAMEHYRAMIESNPQLWPAWINLAQIYRANDHTERADDIERYLRARQVDVDTFKDHGQFDDTKSQEAERGAP
jgi:tetratricopeptide (TPR) repeat protein